MHIDQAIPDTSQPDRAVQAAAESLIASRQNTSPKRLVAPGPDPAQIERLFRAAAAAPDHGLKTPWRFIVIPADKRTLLSDAFAAALVERDASATPDEIHAAQSKAQRSPLLVLAVARLGPCEPPIPELERMVSVGCAIQNMLLTAHSMGFGSGLVSGRGIASKHMRALFQLHEGEQAVCFVNVGTVATPKAPRTHPQWSSFVSSL